MEALKLSENQDLKPSLKQKIKPNFSKGAEYSHISEFKGL